ncbi:cell division protein FtsK, partial [Micromonospora fluostatini]
MADRRAQLVTRVRGMLADALGATRARMAAADADLAAGRERLTRIRRAAAAVPERVGGERDRRLAEIDAHHRARIGELARRAAAAAQREAPGAASAEWSDWRPTPPVGAAPPGAVRVGT